MIETNFPHLNLLYSAQLLKHPLQEDGDSTHQLPIWKTETSLNEFCQKFMRKWNHMVRSSRIDTFGFMQLDKKAFSISTIFYERLIQKDLIHQQYLTGLQEILQPKVLAPFAEVLIQSYQNLQKVLKETQTDFIPRLGLILEILFALKDLDELLSPELYENNQVKDSLDEWRKLMNKKDEFFQETFLSGKQPYFQRALKILEENKDRITQLSFRQKKDLLSIFYKYKQIFKADKTKKKQDTKQKNKKNPQTTQNKGKEEYFTEFYRQCQHFQLKWKQIFSEEIKNMCTEDFREFNEKGNIISSLRLIRFFVETEEFLDSEQNKVLSSKEIQSSKDKVLKENIEFKFKNNSYTMIRIMLECLEKLKDADTKQLKWQFYCTVNKLTKRVENYPFSFSKLSQVTGFKNKDKRKINFVVGSLNYQCGYHQKLILSLKLEANTKKQILDLLKECGGFEKITRNKEEVLEKMWQLKKRTQERLGNYLNKLKKIQELLTELSEYKSLNQKHFQEYRHKISVIFQTHENELSIDQLGEGLSQKFMEKTFIFSYVSSMFSSGNCKFFKLAAGALEEKIQKKSERQWMQYLLLSLLDSPVFNQTLSRLKIVPKENIALFKELNCDLASSNMELKLKVSEIEEKLKSGHYLGALSILYLLKQEQFVKLKKISQKSHLVSGLINILQVYKKWILDKKTEVLMVSEDIEFEQYISSRKEGKLFGQNISSIILGIQIKILSEKKKLENNEEVWIEKQAEDAMLKKRMKLYHQNETRFKYQISLQESQFQNIGAIKKLFEQLRTYHKYFQINSIYPKENQRMLVIQFEKNEDICYKSASLLKIMKRLIEQYYQFLSKDQDGFKYWHLFFTSHNFSITKSSNQFTLKINPLPNFLRCMLLSSNQHAGYISKNYAEYPFIYITQLIEKKMKQDQWFMKSQKINYYQKKQFEHMLLQMRAIEIKLKQDASPRQATPQDFYQCPFFWSVHRKIVEIVTFKEALQNQVNIEEARQKKNQHHYQLLAFHIEQYESRLEKCFSEEEKKKIKHELDEMKALFKQFVAPQPIYRVRKQGEDYTCKEQTQFDESEEITCERREKNRKKVQKIEKIEDCQNCLEILESIEYDYADRYQKGTKCFYTIEGILQHCAYYQNIGNIPKEDVDFINKPYVYDANQWALNKQAFNDLIKCVHTKEDKKYENKDAKDKELKDKLYELTYPSFQTHLRNVRNIFVHNVYDQVKGRSYSFEEKVKIVGESFPKLFIFVYKWKNILSKPLYGDLKYGETKYSKVRNQNSIRNEIYSILRKAFPQTFWYEKKKEYEMTMQQKEKRDKIESERNKRVDALHKTIKQFSKNQNYIKKPQELFGDFSTLYNENHKDRQYDCLPCHMIEGFLGNPKITSIWGLLNDIIKKKFNLLFFQHRIADDTRICRWPLQQEVQYNFFNIIHRSKKITSEERAENEGQLVMPNFKIQNNIEKEEESDKGSEGGSDKKMKKIEKNGKEKTNGATKLKFDKLKANGKFQEMYLENLKKTDYMSNLLIHKILTLYPTLLSDICHTQWLWDEELQKQKEPVKRCWQ